MLNYGKKVNMHILFAKMTTEMIIFSNKTGEKRKQDKYLYLTTKTNMRWEMPGGKVRNL